MTQAPHAKGLPGWVEVSADDPEASSKFYSELFGWTIHIMDPNDSFQYRIIQNDGKTVGGLSAKMNEYQPTQWLTYLETDDIEKTIADVKENGGQVYMDAMPMPGGRFTVASDPAGAPFGIVEGSGMNDSYGGTSDLLWYELETKGDVHEIVTFYEKVFGWVTEEDHPEMSYITFGKGSATHVGGVFGAPNEFPAYLNDQSQWAVTFAVEDLDASVEKAEKLGATVLQTYKGTEYGDIAMLRDPQGALFVVMKSKK